MVSPPLMWVESVDVVPSEGSGKFSVSVLLPSHTEEDTLWCEYNDYHGFQDAVYQQTVPPQDKSEILRFEFTLTQPGSFSLYCTQETLKISTVTTFIVTTAPTVAPPVPP